MSAQETEQKSANNHKSQEVQNDLGEFSTAELRLLNNISYTLGELGFLWSLGSILMLGLVLLALGSSPFAESVTDQPKIPVPLLVFASLLLAFAGYAAIVRPGWGKGACTFSVFLSPLLVPILIGPVFTIFALGDLSRSRASALFGKRRLTHEQVTNAYSKRKSRRIRRDTP
jgi:hypothetical protein